MEPNLKNLTDKALTLPPDDRVVLAHSLLQSVEGFVDPDIERAWLDEAERRWQDIENGRVECIPAEEAMKSIKTILDKKK